MVSEIEEIYVHKPSTLIHDQQHTFDKLACSQISISTHPVQSIYWLYVKPFVVLIRIVYDIIQTAAAHVVHAKAAFSAADLAEMDRVSGQPKKDF